MVTPEEVARQLEKAKTTDSGKSYMACCPAHNDRNPSLSISSGKTADIVFNCFAGCSQDEVIAALESKGVKFRPDRQDFKPAAPRPDPYDFNPPEFRRNK